MKETISENITTLIQDTGDYIEAKTELWKLKAIDKATDTSSSLISRLVIFAIAFIGIIFLNIGIALLIGNWLDKVYYGFFIVAGFYLLAALILYFFKRILLKTPLYNVIINKIMK